MSARRVMTHRCTVWRMVPGDEDPYGAPALTPEEHLSELPCYLWNTAGQGETTLSDRDYVLHEYQLMIPGDTDVTEDDYVEGVTTRRGTTVNGNKLNIKAVIPRPDHMLLVLQEVT